MKRVWSVLLSLILVLTMIPAAAVTAAAEGESGRVSDTATWTMTDSETLTISGTGTVVNMWSWLDSVPDETRAGVKKIVLEEGITEVTDVALETFYNCAEVSVPASAAAMSSQAFGSHNSLERYEVAAGNPNYASDADGVLFDNGMTTLLSMPCKGPVSYAVPQGVTAIGDYALQNCTNLTTLTLPESLKTIGMWAFTGCTALTALTIPAAVENVKPFAFNECTALERIDVSADNSAYASVDGVLFNKDVTELVAYPGGGATVYQVPEGVLTIGDYSFTGRRSVTEVTFPESLTAIGAGAFRNCFGLTGLTLPASLTYIGESAFNMCSGLTDVTIPAEVTEIDVAAFANCMFLKNVTILGGVAELPDRLFSFCQRLERVTLPSTVKTVGSQSFANIGGKAEIVFTGDAPGFASDSFATPIDTVTAYYPAGNATWTEEVRQNYGAKEIIWIAGAPSSGEAELIADYTKGGATVTGIEPGTTYSGEVSFTVEANKACAVAVKNADGTYTVLKCTTADGEHRYTAELTEDCTVVVAYRGDANLDGAVNAKDATLIKQVYLGLVDPGEDAALQTLAADISGDGKLTTKDATAAKQAYLKLITLEW